MALLKSYELDNGFVASYWKITQISFDYQTKIARAIVAGYKDKDARMAGKLQVKNTGYSWSGDDFDNNFSVKVLDVSDVNSIKNAYYLLKLDSFFDGAVDD